MEIIRVKTCRQVAKSWKNQYYSKRTKEWGTVCSGPGFQKVSAEFIYLELMEAHKTKTGTEKKIDSIIGNKSWTINICSCCYKMKVQPMLMLPDGDSSYIICRKCMKKALKKLKG